MLIETRQQQNLYGIFIYAGSTIFILYLAAGQPEAIYWNALFWITQLFIVVNAVVKSFVGEPKNRALYYYSICPPLAYLFSKMLINSFYMLLLATISLLLFTFFLGNPLLYFFQFWYIALLGGFGLSLVFTMLSAIAAKAKQQASLIAILGFPIIIPQVVMLIRLSKSAFGEIFKQGAFLQLTGLLIGLNILVVIMASVLYPYLWKD